MSVRIIEMTREEIQAYAEKARAFIRENPLLAALAAAALGFVVARLTERKIVYIEKNKS
jgi:ElaB/YqjD/DUF883 family membrane-anchored ribosome-binding protein